MLSDNVNVLKRTHVQEIKSHSGRRGNRHHRKAEDRGKNVGTGGSWALEQKREAARHPQAISTESSMLNHLQTNS